MNCPCNVLGRVNGRLMIFLLIVSLPFGWFAAWQLASEAVSGGIHRQGDVTLVDLMTLGKFNLDHETLDDRRCAAALPGPRRAARCSRRLHV